MDRINEILASTGKFILFSLQVFRLTFSKPFEKNILINQAIKIGLDSLPIILISALSMGAVLALQVGYAAIVAVGETLFLGASVSVSLLKELGPLLTAIVISGRIGAAITAEIGTMKVTEQIDALYTLGTNPIKYLAVPRFLGCLLMVPILTVYTCGVGLLGGYLTAIYVHGIPAPIYWAECFDFIFVRDFLHGIIKSVFFAMEIAIVSCYKGFECEGGAEGVGKATTSAVVTTLVFIIISDYFLSSLLIAMGIGG